MVAQIDCFLTLAPTLTSHIGLSTNESRERSPPLGVPLGSIEPITLPAPLGMTNRVRQDMLVTVAVIPRLLEQ